jgi:hypothetical protein
LWAGCSGILFDDYFVHLFDDYFIHVAPDPVLTRLDGAHEGVFGGVEVLCRVFVFGRIAAADVTAFEAEPQMDPPVAHFQAFFTAVGMGFYIADGIEVRTFLRWLHR